jgi:hypothetical protein
VEYIDRLLELGYIEHTISTLSMNPNFIDPGPDRRNGLEIGRLFSPLQRSQFQPRLAPGISRKPTTAAMRNGGISRAEYAKRAKATQPSASGKFEL